MRRTSFLFGRNTSYFFKIWLWFTLYQLTNPVSSSSTCQVKSIRGNNSTGTTSWSNDCCQWRLILIFPTNISWYQVPGESEDDWAPSSMEQWLYKITNDATCPQPIRARDRLGRSSRTSMGRTHDPPSENLPGSRHEWTQKIQPTPGNGTHSHAVLRIERKVIQIINQREAI